MGFVARVATGGRILTFSVTRVIKQASHVVVTVDSAVSGRPQAV